MSLTFVIVFCSLCHPDVNLQAGPILRIFLKIIHTPIASAGALAYNEGLGRSPQRESRGRAPGGGQGALPPEADEVFVFKTVIFNASATDLHEMMK